MARPTELTSTGRQNLDNPPAPTTPPEAAPRVAQLAQAKEGNAPSLGSLQQSGVVFQTGMAVEKGILALANLLPNFDKVAQAVIPQIRAGITQALQSGGEGAPATASAESIAPTAVSPLQQG